MDLTAIKAMTDHPVEFWRSQALKYWRLHILNQKTVKQLTAANRQLQAPLRRWQLEAGNYCRMYQTNLRMVRELRRQNRMLRQLILDAQRKDQ